MRVSSRQDRYSKRYNGDLAISDHAVQRVMERGGAMYLDEETVRRFLAKEVWRALEEEGPQPNYGHEGQMRVRAQIIGAELWAILAVDDTGYSNSCGIAVATVVPA